jgi:hypothetical protein
MFVKCQYEGCTKRGHIGSVIRTYVITSPAGEKNIKLCYEHFEKKSRSLRRREHWTIKDLVTL